MCVYIYLFISPCFIINYLTYFNRVCGPNNIYDENNKLMSDDSSATVAFQGPDTLSIHTQEVYRTGFRLCARISKYICTFSIISYYIIYIFK